LPEHLARAAENFVGVKIARACHLTYVRGRCEIANTWNFGPDGGSEHQVAAPVFASRQFLAYDSAMVPLSVGFLNRAFTISASSYSP
jgi:hypothetical protein